MAESFCTPNIAVTIGTSSRLFHLYITEAPAALDAPSTITLHAGPFADLAGVAATEIAFQAYDGQERGRLILVDSLQLHWQRARYRQNGARLIAADSLLLGASTLERWLWQRLQRLSSPPTETKPLAHDRFNNSEGGQVYVEP